MQVTHVVVGAIVIQPSGNPCGERSHNHPIMQVTHVVVGAIIIQPSGNQCGAGSQNRPILQVTHVVEGAILIQPLIQITILYIGKGGSVKEKK